MSIKKNIHPEPVGGLLLFLFLLFFATSTMHAWWPFAQTQKPFIIMLEAAGNPRQPGRTVDENFEQSITWTFANQLRIILLQQVPGIQVVINRNEREVIEPLHTANFANKLAVDLVLSINVYQETAVKPKVYLYQFSYGTQTPSSAENLAFTTYDNAYLLSNKKSDAYAQRMKGVLKQEQYSNQFECCGINKIPFNPLLGIGRPAFAIEIGLKNKHEWQLYLEPLAQGIANIVENRL